MDINLLKSPNNAQQIHAAQSQQMYPEDIWEMAVQAGKNSLPHLIEAIERGKNIFPNMDFFICSYLHQDPIPILKNKLNFKWTPLLNCPLPTVDQSVYKYFHKDDSLELIWCVPRAQMCTMFSLNPLDWSEEWHKLRDDALDFMSGKLDAKMRELNGEKEGQALPVLQFDDNKKE